MAARPEAPASPGYVQLRRQPYRGHQLLIDAVLRNTRPGDRVFEGGVSSGYVARELVEAGLVVDGAELDPVAAEQARQVCDTVVVGDLQHLDLSNLPHYDVVLFGDTLEHLPDPGAVLARLRSRLKPGGVLVVSIPNVANWAIRLGLLAGRFRYTDRGILDRTHLRFYTRRTLIELLEAAGFRVVALEASVPLPGIRAAWLCRLAHRVGNWRPSLFAYTFIATASPA
jgi:2-polyprenyl-3-methyl-5-hydroxy-6-metoxy-1,4-benzoquinol methylase